MGPLLFPPYAEHVAKRVAALRPKFILETAARTGIVTRAVNEAQVVATSTQLSWRRRAALPIGQRHLPGSGRTVTPFHDQTLDVVLCLFGIMFFPDKVRANAEARRVLRPGGRYVLAIFNRVDLNPVPKAAGEAVATLFPEDPHYIERGPFSYADPAVMEEHLRGAGFEDIEVRTVELTSLVSARDAAHGIILGSPFRGEIERLAPSALERATAAVEAALQPWDGAQAPDVSHLATAQR